MPEVLTILVVRFGSGSERPCDLVHRCERQGGSTITEQLAGDPHFG